MFAVLLILQHFFFIFYIEFKLIKESTDGETCTVNLRGRYICGTHQHCLCISASGSACNAVQDELRARTHDEVALFPASFTFMIKARTKMDKPATARK